MSAAEHDDPIRSGRPAGPLLSIGAFARRSRLSPKALRLYDRLGLLTPAAVDRGNGYRRYSVDQLATARLIVLLRRLGMPLAQVAAVVAAPPADGSLLIASYWDAVEQRVAGQRDLAAYLRTTMAGEERSFGMFEIRERDIPEQLVLTEQRHVLVDGLSNWIEGSMGRLLGSAAQYGGAVAAPFVVYHGEVNEESDGPVEVCVPIDPTREAATQGAARREPAHREAYARLTKAQVAYPQILSGYDAVSRWIETNGKQHGGSPREVYFADFDAAGPNDEVCDVAFPLA